MSEEPSFASLKIVDKFLEASLLTSIGEEENRYKFIGLTVADLVEFLTDDKQSLIQFALTAFLPNPADSEPQIKHVYEALKLHWKTFDNVFRQESPIALYRAIMLEVVARLAASDGSLASIIYHANAAVFGHLKYGVAESQIVHSILKDAGGAAEEFALDTWLSGGANEDRESIKISLPSTIKVDIDSNTLVDGLLAATGPHNSQSIPPKFKPVNTHLTNSPYEWRDQFAPIAATVIENAITSANTSAITDFSAKLSKTLNTKLGAIEDNLRQRVATAPKQLELLWWMQALYSNSQHASYRDLTPVAAAVVAPFDLAQQITAPVPESLIHVLGETVLNATAASDVPSTLKDWLKQLLTTSFDDSSFATSEPNEPLLPGAKSLLAVVRAAVHHNQSVKGELAHVASAKLTPRQFAMWLLRDLICEQLARST